MTANDADPSGPAAAVSPLIERYLQFYIGRSPRDTRVSIGDSYLLVRSAGVLTDAEARLLHADPTPVSRELIERLFRRMFRQSAEVLTGTIESALGVSVRGVMCDLDAAAGESAVIVTFDGTPTANRLA